MRLLRPYQTNLSKRLRERPRLYWRDPGLLHAVLNVSSRQDLLRRPWVGASWEGFVIEQVLAAASHRGIQVEPYFFQTSDGQEVDMVLDLGHSLPAVEVKLTTQPSAEDMRRLNRAADLIGAHRRVLISQTTDVATDGRQISCDLPWLVAHLVGVAGD